MLHEMDGSDFDYNDDYHPSRDMVFVLIDKTGEVLNFFNTDSTARIFMANYAYHNNIPRDDLTVRLEHICFDVTPTPDKPLIPDIVPDELEQQQRPDCVYLVYNKELGMINGCYDALWKAQRKTYGSSEIICLELL